MMVDFLQSKEWRDFQTSFGRKTFFVNREGFSASLIEHILPIAGKYLYAPKGLIKNQNYNSKFRIFLDKIISLATKERAGWIRIDIENSEEIDSLKKNTRLKIVKAPHDMQPREIFAVDIGKSEEQLLSEMKPKTRYNIKLSQKRGVSVKVISNFQFPISNKIQETKYQNDKYLEEFLRLTRIMAKRQGITPHPDGYYKKMLETIPGDILRLYAAEYQGKIVAADLVAFYGERAIYLHGSSDDSFRSVMAPHLLKWKEIQDAKEAGCQKFDFGGVDSEGRKWQGITKFKLGFSTVARPTSFLGSYDIVINNKKYWLYKILQKIKSL